MEAAHLVRAAFNAAAEAGQPPPRFWLPSKDPAELWTLTTISACAEDGHATVVGADGAESDVLLTAAAHPHDPSHDLALTDARRQRGAVPGRLGSGISTIRAKRELGAPWGAVAATPRPRTGESVGPARRAAGRRRRRLGSGEWQQIKRWRLRGAVAAAANWRVRGTGRAAAGRRRSAREARSERSEDGDRSSRRGSATLQRRTRRAARL